MKIVIIDDTLSNLVLLKELVGCIEGCEALTFTGPDTALSWCRQHDPDVVLVDYLMPEMDGVEFIRRFRTLPGRSATPVVIVTACGEKEVLYRALNAGATDFLTRPLDKREFLSRIRNLLALKTHQNELAMRAESLSREMAALAAESQALRSGRDAANSELRQMQKADDIIRLASGIAHDFNNILTAVTGYGAIIRSRLSDTDPLQAFADRLLASTERAGRLSEQLLSFARKPDLERREADLNSIVRETARLLLPAVARGADIELSLSDRPLPVNVDGGQIEQVLVNLAKNARDAMPLGGTVTIETRADVHALPGPGGNIPGPCAVVVVGDCGTGMDEETRQRIFEPFFTTKEKGRGTGLGLANVHDIIRKHNGAVEVESELGKGTAFRVYLPLVAADAAPRQQENRADKIKARA